jgi:Putative transposase of IS4/5 family (DUF4096)
MTGRWELNGVLWVLGTGAQWREMPEKYPPYQTCHRRFQQWVRTDKLEEALKQMPRHLHERGPLNLEEGPLMPPSPAPKRGLRRGFHPSRQGHENHCYRR